MRPPRRSAPPADPARPGREAPGKVRHMAANAPQEVRIIGGRFKRKPLPVPVWPGLRPTPSRVRETLFNWLGQDLSGWRVLDAFAGTGALGLEAASRGAAQVTMIERERPLALHLGKIIERLGATGTTVQTADALVWMKRSAEGALAGRFELVLLDPPFEQDLFADALAAAKGCVVVGGWIYLEADRPFGPRPDEPRRGSAPAEQTDPLPEGLKLHRFGQAGVVHYHLIERVG
jgi:16S rRNA (guanine966-N2)-methyltransferase